MENMDEDNMRLSRNTIRLVFDFFQIFVFIELYYLVFFKVENRNILIFTVFDGIFIYLFHYIFTGQVLLSRNGDRYNMRSSRSIHFDFYFFFSNFCFHRTFGANDRCILIFNIFVNIFLYSVNYLFIYGAGPFT